VGPGFPPLDEPLGLVPGSLSPHLLEGVVLHAFEGKAPFSAETLKEIEQFKKIYGMTLKASDSHQLKERRR